MSLSLSCRVSSGPKYRPESRSTISGLTSEQSAPELELRFDRQASPLMSAGTTPSSAAPDPTAAAPGTFVKHTTSSAAPVNAFIDTTLPPINPDAPVELDSTPISPVARKDSWKLRAGGTVTTPGVDEAAYDELNGETGATEAVRQVIIRQISAIVV